MTDKDNREPSRDGYEAGLREESTAGMLLRPEVELPPGNWEREVNGWDEV